RSLVLAFTLASFPFLTTLTRVATSRSFSKSSLCLTSLGISHHSLAGSVNLSAHRRRQLPSICSGDYSPSPAFEVPLHGFPWMAEPHEPVRPLCFSRWRGDVPHRPSRMRIR